MKKRSKHGKAKFLQRLNGIETVLTQGQRVESREFRTHLKHSHTEAEELLWNYLMNATMRKGQRGIKFVQQLPIGPYFADFCCPRAKLVVEVDGVYHDRQKEYDEKRDDFMAGHGLLVLRFRNDEVLADIQAVLSKIYSIAIERRNVSTYKRGLTLIREIEV
jgi:very-short-patch-repair endonuclease